MVPVTLGFGKSLSMGKEMGSRTIISPAVSKISYKLEKDLPGRDTKQVKSTTAWRLSCTLSSGKGVDG